MIATLLVSRFPLACELLERSRLRGRAVAVARPDGSVWTASAEAEACGVAPGLKLREAISRCPALDVLEGRPALYLDRAEAILAALEQAAPGVEPAAGFANAGPGAGGEHGVAHLDLRGLRRLHGSARGLAAALLACVPAPLEPRLGIGPGKFAALAAAHQAKPGAWRAAGRDVAAFLAGLPVTTLPISEEAHRRLRLLGVTTLAAVAAIPPAALAAQLGPEGELAARLAVGEDEDPVRPRPRLERVVERVELETPVVNREALLVAAEQALTRALRQPRIRERAARQVGLRAETEQGACWERTLTFKEPLGERDPIWSVLRATLQEAQLPGPVVVLRLELAGITAEQGRQLSLPLMRKRVRDHLEEAMRQLKAHYGYCPVGRIVEVEPWSRVPERRLALIDFDP